MRRLILLCLLFMGCSHDHSPEHARIECRPCDGHGNTIAISTVLPVPLAVINTWDLCFKGDTCFWDCPTSDNADACIDQ